MSIRLRVQVLTHTFALGGYLRMLKEGTYLTPVDIGGWRNYNSFIRKEQIELQRNNLLFTDLDCGYGDITFIYSYELFELEERLEELASLIKVVNTETVIEDEVYYTTKIEGAKTTRIRTQEIHNGVDVQDIQDYSEQMVKNCFDAVKLLNLYPGELTEKTLLTVWETLTHKACDNTEIRGNIDYPYRSGDVSIGEYNPPCYLHVQSLMIKWLEFYNSDLLKEHQYIKAALLHLAFERIHPFCDGNGRLGRLLINHYLINQGIEVARAVSLSKAIDANRIHYDVAFIDAENLYNDATPFIEFMLNMFYIAYNEVCNY